MPTFKYKVKDRAGNTRTGTLEAESERAARAMIREAGGLPMEVKPVRGQATAVSTAPAGNAIVRHLIHPIWTGVNIRALAFFFRQLATLLAAGMTISQALRSTSEHARGPLGRILRDAQARVQSGGRLSEEMARYPRVFAPLQVSLVRAGEESGMLDKMTDRVASYLEYEMGIRRKLVLATWYPILVFALIIALPAVVEFIIGTPQAALAILVARLRAVTVPLIVGVVSAKLLFQFDAPRLVWDAAKLQPPVIGMLAHKIAMSRFTKALALLYSSGIPVSRAVSIAADASANVAVGRRVKRIIPALNEGQPLTDSLRKSGVVLPMVLDMMAVGDKTGSYDGVLQKVSDYMEAEADATIHKLTILLFVAMMLLAGLIVGMYVLDAYQSFADKTRNEVL